MGELFKPFQNLPQPELSPEREPVVTVLSSADESLPAGTRMTLSEAETRIGELNESYWNSGEPDRPVKLAIDYMMEGETDRYCLPLYTGPGRGTMLEQMQFHVERSLEHPEIATRLFDEAPAGLGVLLHEHFGPQLYNDLEKLATRVVTFFRQHYAITQLERQFEKQAQAMPDREKEKFLEATHVNITQLRQAANTGHVTAPAQVRAAPFAPSRQQEDPKPRRSVKVRLRQIKEEQPGKGRNPVRRPGPGGR